MANLLDIFGITEEEFSWQRLALCSHENTDLFFDEYEASADVARVVDEMCLSCPVMKECAESAVQNSEWGVWGGMYMVNGKPSKRRNLHKTAETWQEIRGRLEKPLH